MVIAFDRTFDYAKLDVALQAVKRHGARLIGTNPDRTCPVEGGEIPDAAGMIGAVEGGDRARRVEPVVGKPSPIILGSRSIASACRRPTAPSWATAWRPTSRWAAPPASARSWS